VLEHGPPDPPTASVFCGVHRFNLDVGGVEML
jgi:hypothetical protein